MIVTLRLTDECVKPNIDHHRLQRYLGGYCREKKRDNVHLHIRFARDRLQRHRVSDGEGCLDEAFNGPLSCEKLIAGLTNWD
jgi:hypothetical protein